MSQAPADKSPKVIALHDLHPEDGAMLQALYSRSPAGVESHLEKVRGSDTGKFMSRYYVGYGHASIGDCGVTTVFIENYSMLACKAIQDNPLYSGQEASTRYLDFSGQTMVDPYNHPYTTSIQNDWMKLYNSWLPKVIAALKVQHPFENGAYKSEKVWSNAIEARAFDMMRAFLPIGTTTLFSWTTNLRQARDKLMKLKVHPLPEVRDMAQTIYAEIVAKYPHSFSGEEMAESERYADRDAYNQAMAVRENYETFSEIKTRLKLTDAEVSRLLAGELIARTDTIDIDGLNKLETEAMNTRPKGGVLPRVLAGYGNYRLACAIDFGSYRDLQRHRNGVAPLPLVEPRFGIYSWYMQALENLLGDEVEKLIEQVQALFERIAHISEKGIKADPLLTQYLLPMGTTVICSLAYSVPQVVYVGELRSGITVHPSLRPTAQAMLKLLEENHPGIRLYGDFTPDGWVAKRGEQTISETPATTEAAVPAPQLALAI